MFREPQSLRETAYARICIRTNLICGAKRQSTNVNPCGVDNTIKKQGRVCCGEDQFAIVMTHAIVYKKDSTEKKPYNVATNNCQHFATRMSETLLNSFKHTLRMLQVKKGGMLSRAGSAIRSGLSKAGAAVKKGGSKIVAAIKRLFDIGAAAKKNGWSPILSKGGRGRVAAAAGGKSSRTSSGGRRPTSEQSSSHNTTTSTNNVVNA